MGKWMTVLCTLVGCAGGSSVDPPTTGDATGPPTVLSDSNAAEESSGSSGSSTTDASITTDPATTTSATTMPGDSSTTDDTDSGSAICPPEPDDTDCFACGKMACCQQFTDCLADPICNCAIQCIDDGMTTGECETMCGSNEIAITLTGCVYIWCMTECEGV